jgi:hypothetical protein
MPKQLPARLKEILAEINLTERQAVWDCHGTPVVLHKALEKVAAHYKVKFDTPQIIACDVAAKEAVICVTGHMGEATEWSIGEAAPYNNKNSYPFAMAEKRAKDRVILKLVGLHGEVYSEEEADDFKKAKPSDANANPSREKELEKPQPEPTDEPKMEMTTEDRADAWLTFYKDKPDAQKFSKAEERFQKFMTFAENHLSAEVTANLWDKHDERKLELMI